MDYISNGLTAKLNIRNYITSIEEINKKNKKPAEKSA